MRFNHKKMKSTVASRSWTCVPGYDNLTFSGAELDELKRLHILRQTLHYKLAFVAHLHEVGSEAARILGAVLRARKLIVCPRVLKSGLQHIFFLHSTNSPIEEGLNA